MWRPACAAARQAGAQANAVSAAHDAVLYAVRAPTPTVKFIETESPCPLYSAGAHGSAEAAFLFAMCQLFGNQFRLL